MVSWSRYRILFTLLVLAAVAASSACSKPGGDPTRLLPEGADLVAVTPTVERALDAVAGFLTGIEGASGGAELVRARFGLDIAQPQSMVKFGVDVSKPLAFAMLDGGFMVAVSVNGPDAFTSMMTDLLERRWHVKASVPAGAGEPFRAKLPHASVAFGVTKARVGLVTWQTGKADASALYRRLASGAGGLMKTEAASTAQKALADQAGWWLVLGGPPAIPASWGLGPAAALLVPFTSGLTSWAGALRVEQSRLHLDLRGQWTLPGGFDHAWFRPEDPMVPVASVAPKAQTLWLRSRLNLRRLKTLPSFIRSRILPKRLPGPMGPFLPSAEGLLDLLSGDVGLTLLGVDEEATVEHFISGNVPTRQLPQFIHLGLFFGVNDASKADEVLGKAMGGLEQRGYTVAPLQLPPFRGWAIEGTQPKESWAVVRQGNTVGVLSGKGEVSRLHAVQEGRAMSLKAAATGEQASWAVEDADTALGLHASFRRITRELSTKGVPPYFLKVINDIDGVSASIRPDKEGVSLSMEVTH